MAAREIVLDTSVLISALRSRLGVSFRLLSLVGDPRFGISVSVPLVLEYESVAKRPDIGISLSAEEIDAVIDFVCAAGRGLSIFFLWRPHLRDPGDDLVLEAAVAGGCEFIVTHNVRDFAGAEDFGVRVITPGAFLRLIGEVR